jgi:hypothetical protein
VHVEVAVSDRLVAIVIGTAAGPSAWRLGRQTELLAHADLPGGAGDIAWVQAAAGPGHTS